MGLGGQRHTPTTLPPVRTRYPLYRRLGGPQGRSGRVRKISPPNGIRSPDHPFHNESLYRLRYPGPIYIYIYIYIYTHTHTHTHTHTNTYTHTHTHTHTHRRLISVFEALNSVVRPTYICKWCFLHYSLSYGVPVRERYGSTLLPATREQHDQNCTQSH